jgi:hypothetical protein
MNAAPKVLLTATNRWPSASRIAIGLAEAGCLVSAICPRRGHPLLSTRAVRRVCRYGSLRPLQSLIHAIKAVRPDIVVPCDDRGVQHLHELHSYARNLGPSGADLVQLIEFSLGSRDSFPVVSSRCDLMRVAREEGARVPDSKAIKTAADLDDWGKDHALPWVIKGDGTFGGKGVRIARTADQAIELFGEVSQLFGAARVIKRTIVNRDSFWLLPWWRNYRPAISVQAFVEGRPANCSFLAWKGELLGFIGVEVVSSEGQTGPAEIVRVVHNAEMRFAAERIAWRLCLSGFFGLDFMIEQGTGATYLIELNPRCTPLSHLQLGKGSDLPEALGAQLCGRPVRETARVTQNDLIAYFPQLWSCKSEFVQLSYHDIPQSEPALVEVLRRPWPDRSILYRTVSKLSSVAATVKERQAAKNGLISL